MSRSRDPRTETMHSSLYPASAPSMSEVELRETAGYTNPNAASSSGTPYVEPSKTPLPMLELEKVIRRSRLYHADPVTQSQSIVAEFNRGNKEDFTEESIPFGKRIGTDEYRLVHRNNVPQLVPYTFQPRRLGIYPTGTTAEIGIYKQTSLCIGAHGRFLVNVPQGKLVKAWEGMNPILLGEGPHIIRHQNFKLDEKPTVNYSDAVIAHGNYHIVRVPRGKLAKITLNGTPYLLEAREQPYVFDDPTFHIIPNNSNSSNHNEFYFVNASDPLITHDSIKRFIPKTGEVAITYDNGILKVEDKPGMVDSPTFTVDGFLQVNRQTLIFPSPETQAERKKKNPHDVDGMNYEVFRTSDGLPIGVQLLVAFQIEDPQLTLQTLNKNDIKNHIENVVVAHMLSVIQSCTSADFQKSGQNAVAQKEHRPDIESDDIFQMPSEPTPFYSQVHKDTKQLADDLLKIGIRITQLRIEPPKILDAKIAEEMAKNSLVNASARAKASVLGLNTEISTREAESSAEQLRIKTERESKNKIAVAKAESETKTISAQAELDAARLRAEAERILYENEMRKRQLEINLEMQKQQSLMDIDIERMRRQAELFDQHPGLLEYEVAKLKATAMRGIQSMVSPELVSNWYGVPGGAMAPTSSSMGVKTPGVGLFALPPTSSKPASVTPPPAPSVSSSVRN